MAKDDWEIFKSGFTTERRAKNSLKRAGKTFNITNWLIKSRKRDDGSSTWTIFGRNRDFALSKRKK